MHLGEIVCHQVGSQSRVLSRLHKVAMITHCSTVLLMSAVYKMNNSGPRTEPCGNYVLMNEIFSVRCTHWICPLRHEVSYLRTLNCMPKE